MDGGMVRAELKLGGCILVAAFAIDLRALVG
jgi:hypothetical protein